MLPAKIRRKTHLHLDIQNDDAALGGLVGDGLLGGAVAVGAEAGVLDEAVGAHESFELVGGNEVVVDAVGFSRARLARRVRDREREDVLVRVEEPLE